MTLGKNIQKIRKEAHLSQESFAEMLHVSRQTISNWENSKSYPDLETIVKISDSFHISLDILLKEDLVMVKTFDSEVNEYQKICKGADDNSECFCIAGWKFCDFIHACISIQKVNWRGISRNSYRKLTSTKTETDTIL